MDDRRRERVLIPAAGGISLFTVFAVLCLTVFALLSLSTVQADRRLADASAQAVSDYYAADRTAQDILARLRGGEPPEQIGEAGVTVAQDVYSYTVPISDTQELQVEVRLQETQYMVLRWQAAPVGAWEIDENIHVWDGESFE